MSDTATVFNAPEHSTTASLAARASNYTKYHSENFSAGLPYMACYISDLVGCSLKGISSYLGHQLSNLDIETNTAI